MSGRIGRRLFASRSLLAVSEWSRAFVRRRRDNGSGGKIVNVTSVHEAIPSPEASAYGAPRARFSPSPAVWPSSWHRCGST